MRGESRECGVKYRFGEAIHESRQNISVIARRTNEMSATKQSKKIKKLRHSERSATREAKNPKHTAFES